MRQYEPRFFLIELKFSREKMYNQTAQRDSKIDINYVFKTFQNNNSLFCNYGALYNITKKYGLKITIT